MKRIVVVCVTVLLGLSTVGFLPEAHAAASVHRGAELQLLKRINAVRKAKGLDVLVEQAHMRAEARTHSRRMSDQGFFSHAGFEARAKRITARDGGIDGAMCENIAAAFGYTDYRKVANVFYVGWRDSVGHRRCMFDLVVKAGTDSVGIGLVRNGDTWHATYIAANDKTPG